MKSFRDRNPIVIGIVSIAVIGALVGFAFLVGLFHLLEDTYTVQGVFNDAGGIRGGDDVRVAGVKVGRVERVRADREAGRVLVDMVVNRDVELGPETTAEVALQTLLGTKFVRLGGEVRKPYLGDQPERRRVIPLERTKTPFDVFELTAVGTRAVQQTDTERLNRLIGQLADITEGKQEEVGTLVRSLTAVSAAITDRETQLHSLLDRAKTLSATLAEKDQTLVGLIDQSQAVLDLVARRRNDIGRAIDTGALTTEQLGRLLSANKTQLDLILDTLHPTIDILDRRQGDIDRSLSWLGAGTLGLAKASAKGPWQEIYIRSLGPDVITLLDSIGRQQ